MEPAKSAGDLIEQAKSAATAGRFDEATRLLHLAIAGDPGLVDRLLPNAATIVKKGVDLGQITALAPARLNMLVTTGWLLSVVLGRPVTADGRPLPWITQPAIDFVEPRIGADWSVLEWGCGNSTAWWAGRAKSVLSVEHDADWHAAVSASVAGNVRVILGRTVDEYVCPAELKATGPFDAILIDGEHRDRCAAVAVDWVKPEGLIVFDNSDRAEYRGGMTLLMEAGFKRIDFFGLLPAYAYRTCTSLFFKSDAVLKGRLPCDHRSSLGPTTAQVMKE